MWQDVSFACCNVFVTILKNVNGSLLCCCWDVDFGLIVILGEEKRIIVGPLQILSEFAESSIVEDMPGISYTIESSNFYRVYLFKKLIDECICSHSHKACT